jgi:hypothetical protein
MPGNELGFPLKLLYDLIILPQPAWHTLRKQSLQLATPEMTNKMSSVQP